VSVALESKDGSQILDSCVWRQLTYFPEHEMKGVMARGDRREQIYVQQIRPSCSKHKFVFLQQYIIFIPFNAFSKTQLLHHIVCYR